MKNYWLCDWQTDSISLTCTPTNVSIMLLKLLSTCKVNQYIQNKLIPNTFTRSYWREVIRYTPNPKNPSQIQFEDPTVMAMRSARAQSAEGLLRRQAKYVRYEKPWMERKRMKMVRKYKAMEKGVNDLKVYVKFVQDAKKSFWKDKMLVTIISRL